MHHLTQEEALDLTRAADAVPQLEEETRRLAARVDALESALADAAKELRGFAEELDDDAVWVVDEYESEWRRDGLLKEEKANG